MNKYESLIDYAYNNGLIVYERDFEDKAEGFIFGSFIFINVKLTQQQKYESLLHELIHYFKGVGDFTEVKNLNTIKEELRVDKEHFTSLINLDELKSVWKYCRNDDELAEKLNVSTALVSDYMKCNWNWLEPILRPTLIDICESI